MIILTPEQINMFLRNGYSKKDIAFEYDVSIDEIEEIIMQGKQREARLNEVIGIKDSAYNNKDKKKAQTLMGKMRASYGELCYGVEKKEEIPEETIKVIDEFLDSIEAMEDDSKHQVDRLEKIMIGKKIPITFAQIKRLYKIAISPEFAAWVSGIDVGKIERLKASIERRLTDSIKARCSEINSIEELEGLQKLIKDVGITPNNKFEAKQALGKLSERISRLKIQSYNQKRKIIPEDLKKSVNEYISGAISAQDLNFVIDRLAKEMEEKTPKTRFQSVRVDPRKTIVYQAKYFIESAGCAEIRDLEATENRISEFFGGRSGVYLIADYLMAKKRFADAKRFAKKYNDSDKYPDIRIGQIDSLIKRIDQAELGYRIVNQLHSNPSGDSKFINQLLKELGSGKYRKYEIKLGVDKNGEQITLLNIWPYELERKGKKPEESER